MAFKDSQEADVRLVKNADPLTESEIRELMPWMRTISPYGERRLRAGLDLQNLQAIRNFDRRSRRLTWVLIVLTGTLLLLTTGITYYTVVLASK